MKQLTREQFGITSEKMFNFALAMYTQGSDTYNNGTRSAEKAGYKGSDNTLARIAHDNTRKLKIIKVKNAIQGRIRKKLDHNLDKALELLHEALDMSRKEKNTPAFISAVRELDDICGLKQQNDNRQAVAITIQAPQSGENNSV